MIYLILYITCYIIAFCAAIKDRVETKKSFKCLPTEIEAEDVLYCSVISLLGPILVVLFLIYMTAHYIAVLINLIIKRKNK
jgi:hypothetical protein